MAFKENIRTGQSYNVLTGIDPITGKFLYDQASMWTLASDVTFENGRSITSDFEYAEGYLAPGETDIIISGPNITQTGMLDIYLPSAYFHVVPTCIKQRAGAVYMMFPSVREPKYRVSSSNPNDNLGGMNIRVVCHDSKSALTQTTGGIQLYHVLSVTNNVIYTDINLEGDISDYKNMTFSLSTSKIDIPKNYSKPYKLHINCNDGDKKYYEAIIYDNEVLSYAWSAGAEKDSILNFVLTKHTNTSQIYPILQSIDHYGTEDFNEYPISNPYNIYSYVTDNTTILLTDILFPNDISKYLGRDVILKANVDVPSTSESRKIRLSYMKTSSYRAELEMEIWKSINNSGGSTYEAPYVDAIHTGDVITIHIQSIGTNSYRAYIYSIVPYDPSAETSLWSTGTDAEIVSMVQAADRGEIDLTEYWSVGDKRTISLAAMPAPSDGVTDAHDAQNVTMVLVAADTKQNDNTNPCYNYKYVTPTSDRTYPSFIIQQENCLNVIGKMDPNYTDSGKRGWDQCPRRNWCNNQYKSAFPSSLLSIIKQVQVQTWTYDNEKQISSDYFFLAAEKEIQGERTYSMENEASTLSLWSHYSTTSNKMKESKVSLYWWLRSPSFSSSTNYCSVNPDGSAYNVVSTNMLGLAPCACI